MSIVDVHVDLAQLAAFAAVVDEGSFDAAAAHLHLTPSAVSQRIKALEQSAGRVLVRRSRPPGVTKAEGGLREETSHGGWCADR